MTDTVEEYDRLWSVYTPRNSLARWMGNIHISVTDAEIEQMVRDQCARAPKTKKNQQGPGFTPEIVQECVDYALIVRRNHRALMREFSL